MGKIFKTPAVKDNILLKLGNARKALYIVHSNIPDKTLFLHQIDKNRIDKLHRNYEILLRTIDRLDEHVKSESGVSSGQLQILKYLKSNPNVDDYKISGKIVFNKLKKVNLGMVRGDLQYLEKQGFVISKYELYKTLDEKDPHRQVIKRVYYWTLTGKGRKMV